MEEEERAKKEKRDKENRSVIERWTDDVAERERCFILPFFRVLEQLLSLLNTKVKC